MGTLLFHEVRDLVGQKGSFPDYSDFALVEINAGEPTSPGVALPKKGDMLLGEAN